MTKILRIQPDLSLATKAYNVLREYIVEDYQDGGMLPGELELADQLGVTRGTIRKALGMLERDGYIRRQRGDGTYVNSHVNKISTRLDEIVEYQELVRRSGYESSQFQLELVEDKATNIQADHLLIPPGSPILVSNLVIHADGIPAIYVQDSMPLELIVEEYDPDELEVSIFNFLEDRCHVRLSYSTSEICSRICGDELSDILQIQPSHAILQLISNAYDVNDKPIMHSMSYFRSDMIRLHIVSKRKL